MECPTPPECKSRGRRTAAAHSPSASWRLCRSSPRNPSTMSVRSESVAHLAQQRTVTGLQDLAIADASDLTTRLRLMRVSWLDAVRRESLCRYVMLRSLKLERGSRFTNCCVKRDRSIIKHFRFLVRFSPVPIDFIPNQRRPIKLLSSHILLVRRKETRMKPSLSVSCVTRKRRVGYALKNQLLRASEQGW